jgi:hypothetical protein
MTDPDQDNTAGQDDDAENILTPGAGNTDLTGQARKIVESTEEGTTGPTPGGG